MQPSTLPKWNPDARLTTEQLREELKKKKPGGSSPTSQLTRAVLATLHVHGFNAWRNNNVGVYDAKLGKHRANSAKKGVSDVIGFREGCGRWAAVEVKVGEDKLSDEQTAFLADIKRAGGFAFECRDNTDALLIALRQWLAQFK
ncbi:VRR-NUC domain-containing protein [Hymenobacter sp. M29]|uniref:VRR-NUC domain-containing protein n=1 Tax=Hymenobacter mellowenesis TaxID=3063995 RepID=A0ABT9AKB6_9BACT|nr:VRR-NUC domain-containing protein [Hymenobacter sp. M29]MDO7849917.1 VRR-NUC domain-containing protein [Hymenobacter sp. M29]